MINFKKILALKVISLNITFFKMKNIFSINRFVIFNIFIFLILLFLTISVLNENFVITFDQTINNLVSNFQTNFWVDFFLLTTLLWNWRVIIFFIFLLTIIFIINKNKNYIVPLFVTVLWSQATTYLLKASTERQRPENAVYEELFFSFPSWHATIAVAFYWFLTYFLIKENKKFKNLILTIWILIILFLSFSRIYIQVHFLSDVIWWIIVWLIWLSIGIYINNLINKKIVNKTKLNISKKIKIINYILIIIWILFYIIYSYFYMVGFM